MRPDRPCPVVNWGRGRLLLHESIGGFAAKFCDLNGLKAREFRAFLDCQLGSGGWSRAALAGHSNRRVAQILGESLRVVRTLGMECWRLPACFGTFRLERPDPPPGLVRFCPACLADGYHAGFHEPAWLQRCLLHGLPLESRWVSVHRAGTAFDAYVETVRGLLSSGSASAALSPRARPGLLKALSRERFQSAQRWFQAARRLRGRLVGMNLMAARGSDYAPQDLGLLLGRLAYHLPLPMCLTGSAGVPVAPAHPTLVRAYPSEVVREFQARFPSGHPEALELFGGFLRKTDALTGAEPDYRRQALAVATDWAADHEDCRCAWVRGCDGRWLEYAPSRWDPPDTPCPVRVAIDELREEWVDFVPASASARARRETQRGYFRAFEVFAARHWVARASGGAEAGPPEAWLARQLRWSLGESLRRLIQDLLHEGFLHHVAELEAWRVAVREGASPGARVAWPSASNLFLDSPGCGAPVLVRWPVCPPALGRASAPSVRAEADPAAARRRTTTGFSSGNQPGTTG
jgi:hypothetical protein